jgi:hypothetical protein
MHLIPAGKVPKTKSPRHLVSVGDFSDAGRLQMDYGLCFLLIVRTSRE